MTRKEFCAGCPEQSPTVRFCEVQYRDGSFGYGIPYCMECQEMIGHDRGDHVKHIVLHADDITFYAVPQLGAFYGIDHGVLYYIPMLVSGAPEVDQYGDPCTIEVDVIEGQDAIQFINNALGTAFTTEFN
jgi:hypothetical protein